MLRNLIANKTKTKKSDSCTQGRPSISFMGSQNKHIDATTEHKKDEQTLRESKRIKDTALRTSNECNSSKIKDKREDYIQSL